VKSQQAAYSVVGVDEEVRRRIPLNPHETSHVYCHVRRPPPHPSSLAKRRKENAKKRNTIHPQLRPRSNGAKARTNNNNNNNSKPADASKPHKSKNTAVYVTNLPRDTEVDELLERFGKCGVIEEDDEGEPKIKMYAREDGSFSGEALVVFFKEDSVTLALN
jgi:HIV Tat-specific factor 1